MPKRKNFDIQRNTRVGSGGQFTSNRLSYHLTGSLFFITLTQARRILRLKAEPLENLSVDQIHDKFIHEKLKMVIKIKRKREKEGCLPFGILVRGKMLIVVEQKNVLAGHLAGE